MATTKDYVTYDELKEVEDRLESRLYTVRDEMMGRINARFAALERKVDKILAHLGIQD